MDTSSIQDWCWIGSSLRLIQNFAAVHAYEGAILSTGWLVRPREEAVLNKGIQMFLEVSDGNQVSAFTLDVDGCSTVKIFRRYWSLHVPTCHFLVSFSLCLNSFYSEEKQLTDSAASKCFFHCITLAILLFLVAVSAGMQVSACICFSPQFLETCDKHILDAI